MRSYCLRQIHTMGWFRILVGFLLVWLVILFVTVFPMLGTHLGNSESKTSEKLVRALQDLEALRRQNEELQEIFKEINTNTLKGDQREALENFQQRLTKAEHNFDSTNPQMGFISAKEEPNTQYELLRRRLYNNVNEFWNFVKSGLDDLTGKVKDPDHVLESVRYLAQLGAEHKRSLLYDLDQLAEADGYATWREKEANELSDLVQTRLYHLQNPPNCDSSKKLICTLNKGCGYGCQLHHVVYCFMVAYGTKRTLILKSQGWRYHKKGWEDVFKPVSDTCVQPGSAPVDNWPGHPNSEILHLPIIDSLNPRPPFLPLTIPEDLAPRLVRLHGDPIVWWVGQILKYLLRPQPNTASMLQETMTKMGFKRPIVGVHVRRTDKVGTEAAFHRIEEYMAIVEEYYSQLSLKQPIDQKRIYLASDDPKVLVDAKAKYPDYEILGDPSISKTAAVSTRYTDSSLFGIINDIHMLAMSDFLVCTFSSQVCRVAYEIMQAYYPDAASRFRSLDDIYYYGGQNAHNTVAVLGHQARRTGEMSMMPGDLIGIAGNHWNGFSKGRNLRTNQIGLFPGFKVKDKVETAKFPTYQESTNKNTKSEE